MGKKKATTRETNRPIYTPQIDAAAAFNQSAMVDSQPQINQFANNASMASQDLFERASAGDPTITAAQGYIQDTLGGDITQNPYLDDIIAQTNSSVRNQLQAQMGTRGQTGGSDYYDMISKALAQNESGLRFDDYNNAMQRRAQAAGMAPSVTAGSLLPLDAALKAGNQGAMTRLNAAALNSASTGGLLGQYQNRTGEQSQSGGLFGAILGSAIGGLAGNPGIF
ncbi:MAG: hypothetical protein AAGF20_06735 [Pseudomonadota bacterium]